MNALRFMPVQIVAALIAAAGTASALAVAAAVADGSHGAKPTASLKTSSLRGIGSRRLQGGGTDEIAPMLTTTGGLSKCQGHCVSDEQCAVGLACWIDWDESGLVPGCAGTAQPDSNYCIDPNDAPLVSNTPSPTGTDIKCVPPGEICEVDDMGAAVSMCCSTDDVYVCVDSRCVTTDPPTDMPTDAPTGTSTTTTLTIMPTSEPTATPSSMPVETGNSTNSSLTTTALTVLPTSAPTAPPTSMPVETGNNTNSSLTERPELGVCEGDCDYDEDCADGLECFYADGSGVVPGCSGSPREGWEYCIATDSIGADSANSTAPSLTEADLINECEGDCDWDEDCADGLVCWYDDDETGDIPGCTGTPRAGWEYCIDPIAIFKNATHVEWLDDFEDDLGPGEYGRCQGDCDDDIDCEGELVCFYPTDEIRIVPGCKGRPTPDWEYCADPKDVEEHAKRFGSKNSTSTAGGP